MDFRALTFACAAMLLAGQPEAPAQERADVLERAAVAPDARDWRAISADGFVRSSRRLMERQPTEEQLRPVVKDAWNSFLADDSRMEGVPPAMLMKISDFVRDHARLLEGEGLRTRDVLARLQTVRGALRRQLGEEVSRGVSMRYSQLRGMWTANELDEQSGDFRRRADSVAHWMEENDWRQLQLTAKMEISRMLSADLADRKNFSARWSGQIHSALGGDYRLGMLRHPLRDGAMRIYLGDQLVFDSQRSPADEEQGRSSRLGAVVSLGPRQPLPLRVEYGYQAEGLLAELDSSDHSSQFPMAVLMWERAGGLPEIVPPEAFAVAGPGAEPASGLVVEYFRNADFSESLQRGTVSAIGQIWSSAPLVPAHPQKLQEVLQVCFDEIADIVRNGGAKLPDSPAVYRFAGMLDVRQRQQLLGAFSQSAELGSLSPIWFGHFCGEVGMLPGEGPGQLIRNWAAAAPGGASSELIGNPDQYLFYRNNHRGMHLISLWTSGLYQSRMDSLLSREGVSKEGIPNLEVIRLAAHSAYRERDFQPLSDWMRRQQPREPLTGDLEAEWLMAQGWAQEAMTGETGVAPVGLPYFQQALAAARSPNVQFAAVREVLIRQMCLAQFDDARSQLEQASSRFTAPGQREELQKLDKTFHSLQTKMKEWEQTAEQDAVERAEDTQLTMLKERLEKAQLRGDAASAAKFQKRLNELSALQGR